MATISFNFTADDTGDYIVFKASTPAELTVDNVSIKEVTTESTPVNYSVKEFLSGTTDEGNPIFFRADSQQLQMNEAFEELSSPISIVNRTQRGSLMKCFVALDDNDFYEIQGEVSKGVSILKIHSKDRSTIVTPPLAREIKVSWRDSSKQLCRLIQTSVVFVATPMEYTE